MHSVEVRLSFGDLSKVLVSMREWLDHQGFEPSVFRYNRDEGAPEVVVRLTFKSEKEAAEFGRKFDGIVLAQGGSQHFSRTHVASRPAPVSSSRSPALR